jgi:hypothetical protein
MKASEALALAIESAGSEFEVTTTPQNDMITISWRTAEK